MRTSFRRLPRLGRAWKPLDFPKTFSKVVPNQLIEEEELPRYVAAHYYPVRLGEVLQDRYQIVGKLGFGANSTVWLARDLSHRRHVAIKFLINSESKGGQHDDELNIYKRIDAGPKSHPGYCAIRTLIDSFEVDGHDGKHRCLVHPPLFESVKEFLYRNPVMRLPVPIVAIILKKLFLALDFLHTECQIIHTDIKADNIMFGIDDDTVFTDFEQQELQDPCPRKEIDGRTIYLSRDLRWPKHLAAPVLCDFGSAMPGDTEHTEDVQPNIYRSPEVILGVPWSYEIDIWNTGAMVWDIFEGGCLFTGQDPELNTYRGRAHVAEMIALLDRPPQELLAQGRFSRKFFTEDGTFSGGIPIPSPAPLNQIETNLKGPAQEQFLRFMHKMLQWKASDRRSAGELVKDEWIQVNTQD